MRVFGAACWKSIFQYPIKQLRDPALIDVPLNLVGNYILCFAFPSFSPRRGRRRSLTWTFIRRQGTNQRGKTTKEGLAER